MPRADARVHIRAGSPMGLSVIAEMVVVEGPSDAVAVHRAVEADVLCTGGHAFGVDVEARLRRAHATRGLVVFTDPDPAGEQIRRRVEAMVGPCRHAHLTRAECTRDGDIGVEHASPAAVRAALARARPGTATARTEFHTADLWAHGLTGPGSRARRVALGQALGIGYGNARQLLRRLNRYGVTRDELDAALAKLP